MRPEPGLSFILPLIAMLTKELEMLQLDAFCKHTMQQNANVARALSLAGFKGAASWRGRERKGRRGSGRRGRERGGEFDSDAQLEQGR